METRPGGTPEPKVAAKVIQFPTQPPAVHVACSCGSEWWQPLGVVIDAETDQVTGYAYPLTCVECGETRGPTS